MARRPAAAAAAAAAAPVPPALTISCEANAPDTVVVTFSEEVDITTAQKPGDPGSYTIALFAGPGAPITVNLTQSLASVQLAFNNTIAIITLRQQQVANPITLIVGQQIQVTVNPSIKATSGHVFATSPATNVAVTQVLGVGNALGNIATNTGNIATNTGSTSGSLEDLAAFSLLTEEVGYPPSPLARSSSGAGTMVPAAGGSLGQIAAKAVSDVLGWQAKPDPKGFLGALNASFKLEEVEGHTQAIWTPRTYAIQTDLSGGITGAQASVYQRAKDALDRSLPLLDGLYPLFKEAKDEEAAALRATVRSQFTDLVNELGLIGGPRISRVTQLFFLLLGQQLPQNFSGVQAFLAGTGTPPTQGPLQTDPDKISGSLGNLRVEFGFSIADDRVNTVEDEQDVTNFRIVSDYVTSLAQSWLNNLQFFGLGTPTPFFGTQLVLLSRQLSVIAESSNEVRFTLDSVFIGPAERQTLQIQFTSGDPPMFLEDLLTWIDSFASEEGPRLIQDGGKFAVGESFVPIGTQLQQLVAGAVTPANLSSLPQGYQSKRVRRSLVELKDQLQELVNLAAPISHVITPEPEPALAVLGINPNVMFLSALTFGQVNVPITIIGTGFDTNVTGFTTNTPPPPGPGLNIIAPGLTFLNSLPPLSENLIFAPLGLAPLPTAGNYVVTITVTNRDLKSATLQTSFTVLP
jgi:hypothetical protein